MINMLEEQMWVEGGLNANIVNDQQESFWSESWIDEVKEIMSHRSIKLHDLKLKEFRITLNKTIIEYAREYVYSQVKNIEMLKLINHVRMFKQVFLPCKLVGKSRREYTEASIHDLKLSQLKWTFYHHCIKQPSCRALKVWK